MNSLKTIKETPVGREKGIDLCWRKGQREKKASNRLQNYCGEIGMTGKYKSCWGYKKAQNLAQQLLFHYLRHLKKRGKLCAPFVFIHRKHLALRRHQHTFWLESHS